MAFTDEDLKQLKECLNTTGDEYAEFQGFKLKPLIARLGALNSAVKVAREIQRGAISWEHFDAVYKACQEAAGKGDK